MVTMYSIWGFKKKFEETLGDQNGQFYDNENLSWFEKLKEISSLHQELDAISKSLAVLENLNNVQLKHMEKEELVSFFKTEMTKIKKNHQLKVQEITKDI